MRKISSKTTRIVALAGGVGGAKMSQGLNQVVPGDRLAIIVNIGDDFEHYGLKICPDLDTVCYTLSNQSNPATGWGMVDETWQVLQAIETLGGPTWFQLGDRDLGTHLERTRRLNLGQPLSKITQDFCRSWGIQCQVLPVTDQKVPTMVHSNEGDLSFQEYFVHRKCSPIVTGFDFVNVSECVPAPGVLEALETADLIVLCPSNPFVSLDPVLEVPGIWETIQKRRATKSVAVVAVTPIIGGDAVKGPAAKMLRELGHVPSALAVAHHYEALIDGFVLDRIDHQAEQDIVRLGIVPLVTDTLMPDLEQRTRLATEVIDFGLSILVESNDSVS